ncbi:TPA: cytochrome c4, partial [Xanthomonas vasicola pv. zeae]|nr:cytochrome c4 [Xanthomonas vasicola pv. zeae]
RMATVARPLAERELQGLASDRRGLHGRADDAAAAQPPAGAAARS